MKTKQFTVNIISEPFVEAANMCSIEAPSDVDEWVVSGLTPVPSVRIAPLGPLVFSQFAYVTEPSRSSQSEGKCCGD